MSFCPIRRLTAAFQSQIPADHSLVFFLFLCRTSLFIVCSGLYGLLLVVVCVAFLSAELATNQIPLHYFEVRDRQREENANTQQETPSH